MQASPGNAVRPRTTSDTVGELPALSNVDPNYEGRGWYARVIVRTSVEQGWQRKTCSQAGSSIERVRVANSIRIRYRGQPARSGFAWTRE
jgi:hypothetical protein